MLLDVHLSTLEVCPSEVLENIVLALVDESLLGPPTDLPSLLRVSKAIYLKISIKTNPSLYSSIFVKKFDDGPAVRRLGETCKYAGNRANELVKRFQALKRFKFFPCRLLSSAPTARGDIWLAYLLFLENDQRNYDQLVHYAGVDTFAASFVKHGGPFHDGVDGNGGWKLDTQVNALVAWLFWFTDKERMVCETPRERQHVLAAFAHIFVGSFKYASTHAPITSFHIPPLVTPPPQPSTPALPLAALPSSRLTFIKDHFGINIPIATPLLTPAALLICVVRLEAAGTETQALPETWGVHRQPTTRFAEWGQGRGSEQYEHDWIRLLTCYSPWDQPMIRRRVFTPGMVSGTWVGRLFEIPRAQFDAILNPDPFTAAAISPLIHVYPIPMQFHLREYHLHDGFDGIGYNDISQDLTGEGVFKAWLPQGVTMTETQHHMDFFADYPTINQPIATYDAYDPATAAKRALDAECARSGLYSHGVNDIFLSAWTADCFGNVWGHKRYFGRVRDWDGLILLVSVATETEPLYIFSGYVHGDQNLVGRWRETSTPVDRPGWEGVWSMTKVA